MTKEQERIAHLESELARERSVLAMAVARLGGIVDGEATHRGNFLQRIDALVKFEKRILSRKRK
jgi:hypothetical protein